MRAQLLNDVQICATLLTVARQVPLPMGFSRQEYWSGLPCSSPGDLPDPAINPGLPYCRWILYQLSPQGIPRILGWVAIPFPRGSLRPKDQTQVSSIAGRVFII